MGVMLFSDLSRGLDEVDNLLDSWLLDEVEMLTDNGSRHPSTSQCYCIHFIHSLLTICIFNNSFHNFFHLHIEYLGQ